MHDLVRRSFGNLLLFIRFLWAFLKSALSIIKRETPDLLHAHWWLPAGIVALVASKLTKKPFLLTVHGTDVRLLDRFTFLNPVARLVFSRARSIVTVSSFLQSKITRRFSLPSEKFRIIPMPITIPPLSTRASHPGNRLITIARLSKQKGLEYLIAACAVLREKNVSFELKILGEGEEHENLKRQVETLNLQAQIRFGGAVAHDRIYSHLAAADIFILPSLDEGLGLAIIEAMACNKPVIATNSGGIPDIVRDGDTGLLIPPRDAGALAQAIERLLNDQQLAVRLAQQGYRFVSANFSPEKIASQVQSLYQQIINDVGR